MSVDLNSKEEAKVHHCLGYFWLSCHDATGSVTTKTTRTPTKTEETRIATTRIATTGKATQKAKPPKQQTKRLLKSQKLEEKDHTDNEKFGSLAT